MARPHGEEFKMALTDDPRAYEELNATTNHIILSGFISVKSR